MEATADHSGNVSRRGGKRRALKWILISIAIIIIVVIVIVPVYLSSESGKQLVLSRINSSIDGKVDMKTLSVGWFKGIRLTGLTFLNTAGTTSVNVKQISAKPRLPGLLWGNFALNKTVVDKPEIVINLEEQPQVAVRDKTEEKVKVEAEEGGLALAMLDLEVKEGNARINLSSNDRRTETVEFRNIASKVNLNPLGQKSTFDLAMSVASNDKESQVSATGSLKRPAKKRWTLKGTSGDVKVHIDKLDLSTLTPLFALAGKDIRTGGVLNADADVKIADGRFERILTKATLTDFKRIADGKETVLREPVVIDADVSSKDDIIVIHQFSFDSSFCNVSCSGSGNTVDYNATADLRGLTDFGDQFVDLGEYDFSGSVSSKGMLAFEKTGIKVSGQGLAERLVINKGKLTTPATTANLGFDIQTDTDKNVATVKSASIMADPGRIEIANSVFPLGDKSGEIEMGLSAELDLKKIQPFLGLAVEIPEGMTLGGRLISEASINGKGSRYKLVTKKTNIDNLLIVSRDQEPFQQKSVRLMADIVCDTQEKEITINDLLLEGAQGESLIKVLKGKFNQSSSNDKTKVSGELEAQYDLATVSALASPFMPQGLAMEGKRTTNLKFNSEYPKGTDQFLANLNGNTSLGFDKAQYKGMNFSKANLQLDVNQGLLTLDLPATKVNDGTVNFAGNINFKEKPPTLRMAKPSQLAQKVRLNKEISGKLLMFLNPIFVGASEIEGFGDFYCEKMSIPLGSNAAKEDIEVTGTVALDKVRLKGKGLLGQLIKSYDILEVTPTRFVLQDGFVNYDDMAILVDNRSLNFAGKIGLDKSMDMTVTLPLTYGKVLGTGDESTSRITLPIEGTLDNPKINEGRLIEDAGKKLLEDQLKKGLEDIFR